jgi:dGTPase
VAGANLYGDFDYERRGAHASKRVQRSPFEVDKGRIIHSASFRRLQGKTQVLGVGERDFYRTRLTHSLEVAQLGRGLCVELDGDFQPHQDLVEAICLAHDIGHPPFGHSGEDFLHGTVKNKYGGFGANPQNLRIVTLLEAKFADSGLDLTRATLDGLVKYPNLYDAKKRQGSKFTYRSDQKLLQWIKKGIKNQLATPVEGQLADWADQMAYSVNDIEDVVRAGLLNFADMNTRAAEISATAEDKYQKTRRARDKHADPLPSITSAGAIRRLAEDFEERFAAPAHFRERKVNLKAWTSESIKKLSRDCRIVNLKNGEHAARYRFGLLVPPAADALAAVLKTTALLLVFRDPRVTTLEAKGHHIINQLFKTFRERPDLLPLDFQELIKEKQFGSKERLIADFIAGMTDRYAYLYYKRLFHPDTGSFYEDV